MLGLILTILVIIILLAGVIYYVSVRNNEMNDKYVNSLTKYNNFKKNAFGHITNSLKEIDYLNRKTGSLGSNKDSTCYRSEGNIVKGCECHDSCSTCGYSNNPNGINQCLKCKNGNEVNSLYNNGAGWCGSFNEKGEVITSTPSIDATFSNNEASANATTATATSATATSAREMTCNERFARMCASSSDWVECLEKNKQSLVLAGCNITLESDGSSSGSSSGSAADTGMVKKDFLNLLNPKMLANEFLQSSNSKFKLLIENNGQIIIEHKNGTQKWSAQRTSLSTFNGPYYLEFNSSFNLILYDKTSREVWNSETPTDQFSPGPNVKVLLDDNGILQIFDNGENKRWDSETYTATLSGNAGSSSASSSSASSSSASSSNAGSSNAGSSNAGGVPANAPTTTTLNVFGHAKNQACPTNTMNKYIVDGADANNIACSNNPTNINNACALKGYKASNNMLPRCYPLQIAKGSDGKLYTCSGGTGTVNSNGKTVNNYIITTSKSTTNGLKCYKFKNGSYKSDPTGTTNEYQKK